VKITLEFNDDEEYQTAIDGWKWKAIVIEVLFQILRPIWKYGEDRDKAAWAEQIKDKIGELMDQYNLED